jgi:alpha-L-arabinofuranosidase
MLKIYRIFGQEELDEWYCPTYPYEITEKDIFETIETDEISEELIQNIKDVLFAEIKAKEVIDKYDEKNGWVTKLKYENPKEDWIEVSKKENGNVEITFVSDFIMEGFVIVKT